MKEESESWTYTMYYLVHGHNVPQAVYYPHLHVHVGMKSIFEGWMAPLTYEAVKGGWKRFKWEKAERKNDKKIAVTTPHSQLAIWLHHTHMDKLVVVATTSQPCGTRSCTRIMPTADCGERGWGWLGGGARDLRAYTSVLMWVLRLDFYSLCSSSSQPQPVILNIDTSNQVGPTNSHHHSLTPTLWWGQRCLKPLLHYSLITMSIFYHFAHCQSLPSSLLVW